MRVAKSRSFKSESKFLPEECFQTEDVYILILRREKNELDLIFIWYYEGVSVQNINSIR